MTKYIISVLQGKAVGLFKDFRCVDSTGQEYTVSKKQLGATTVINFIQFWNSAEYLPISHSPFSHFPVKCIS